MLVKLAFIYYPVADLGTALRFYRDELGFEEAWREGQSTAGLKMPGTEVRIMLDVDPVERRSGGVFQVDSVDTFYAEHESRYHWIKPPVDIPDGRWAVFEDPTGNLVRLIDESRA
jgi:catechol 2,3-dioxygenase-like lactoylglutathione lyase family enzyme